MAAESAGKVIAYMRANQAAFLEGFKALLAIPSISTDPAYKAEMERCAAWIAEEMTRIGLQQARVIPTGGHPVVYSEWLEAGAGKPTVAIYAHYDVQPVDPLELWETPPFEASIREGRIYARGTCDDKCGVWGTLKVLEAIFAVEGKLPFNVKLMFEGEEETGSPSMEPFVAANKEQLKADVFVMCDGGFTPDDPELAYALRGIVDVEVKVSGPDHDLHSGEFGGVVENPLHVAGKIIGAFHDSTGRVQIPGFYDPVQALSKTEKANLDAIWNPREADLLKRAGVKRFWAETLGSYAERTTALPTLEVNGMWGGYQGEGSKTVIPAEAGFKVSMRLVPDQNPNEVARQFEDFVHSFESDTIQIQTTVQSAGWPFTMAYEGPIADALRQAFAATMPKPVRWTRIGASAAIGGMFQQQLGVPMVDMGLGTGENYHAPNEYQRLDHYDVALDTMIHFLYNVAEIKI